jgi:hypothetical protein
VTGVAGKGEADKGEHKEQEKGKKRKRAMAVEQTDVAAKKQALDAFAGLCGGRRRGVWSHGCCGGVVVDVVCALPLSDGLLRASLCPQRRAKGRMRRPATMTGS